MRNNYYTIVSEGYEAYIGRYPKESTIEYLLQELPLRLLEKSSQALRNSGKMSAQLILVNAIAEKYVRAKKLGITLDWSIM